MRKRSATCRGQIPRARGGARTMLRLLPAALLLAAAAHAWRPPPQPLHIAPRLHMRHNNHTRHLHLFGWHVELRENRAITSPHYNECQFYRGRVLHEEDSSATVTECDGQLYGLLQVGDEEFVLQPTRPSGNHVLRRRDVLLSEQPAAYNLTGDTVTDLELEFEENHGLMPFMSFGDDSDLDYFRDLRPVTRSTRGVKGLWLEMAIMADHTMLKFHGRERVEHYILALMNIVSAIFNDPSMESNMTLVINKLFLNEEKDSTVKYGNVRKSLEAVNKWNYKHLSRLPKDATGWDVAIWLTRVPLGGPSGFAPVGGVCSSMRSASINRDEGLTSAFVIAHELAHLLGLTHDGDNQCEKDSRRGTVMAPTVLATLQNFAWSKCSREQFHEKSRKWWCLHERSRDEGVELGGAKEISNYVFTMDEQCRTEFGEGFSVCKTVKVRSACSRLWCAHRTMPHVCRTKRAPPLEGTPCGNNRWCVNRVCQPMPGGAKDRREKEKRTKGREKGEEKSTESRLPRWEDWSEWSTCNVSCGYGLRTRNRQCWFQGLVSESACEGASSQMATCFAGECVHASDLRTDLCLQQSNRYIPYIHPDESKTCELWCVDYDGGDPLLFGTLHDGSSCSYTRPYDICFQGTCIKGQCNSTDPACNWCPDGYCSNNTYLYTKFVKGWTRLAVIPYDAHQLSMHVATPASIRVAFKELGADKHILEVMRHSRRFAIDNPQYNDLKYDPNVPQNLQIVEVDIREGLEGSAVVSGAVLQWRQTDSHINITSLSKLQRDLVIMASPDSAAYDMFTVEVSVNYSTPAGRTHPQEYRWPEERGVCSVSCGGGIRIVRTQCPRDQPCAKPRLERCNSHSCEFSWRAGEWEGCSATCGERGFQERQLYCVPTGITISSQSDLIKNFVSPVLCPDEKPEKQQPCNQIPCPSYWQEMPWTPCSTTCGRGISRRPLICPAPNDILCGPKPRERRRRCRQRRCPLSLRQPQQCTNPDSQYCQHYELPRNCVLAPFRRLCCNACKRYSTYNAG
ncbi:A disintegrin and metalloproteinase with thrombospondin motifs 1-like [Amyelois transitella]|uniref:A disintegrin and metalloproteinase with thrombospondin motifs 1-like n=1 Tax=Amyelois transitella TaxID=680683 RepID=UPI00298FE247|nr:A disintegrin and metalloproteinase with thrombospondin motifs 1-like [Amyelois transitella]